MTVPSATSRTNEAAERLRKRIRDERDQLNPLTALGDLDRALSEERRRTIERIRERAFDLSSPPSNEPRRWAPNEMMLRAILDEIGGCPMTPSQAAQEKPTSPVGDRYRLHLGGPVALAARCPHCNHRVIVEEREAAAATPSLDRNLLAEAIFESGVRQTMSQSEQAADNILAEIPIILARLDEGSATPNGERR